MRISIVIPTYNHCEDLLKPCLESIKKYSNLSDIEVLVVANGCVDSTKEYVESLGSPFKLIWMKDPAGYTKATNEGIKVASGEFVVLLNNDTVLLPQENHNWLHRLVNPFYQDERVGITGPMKTFCPEAKREFLIFFCVCIRRKLFDELGILDEIFSPGYGEDTDFCCKLENAGYKIHSVCENPIYSKDDEKVMLGDFPIYHKGNVTFKNWPGGEELLKKNNGILRKRYAEGQPDISKAVKCDGFINDQELRWLGKEAMKRKTIIEIGSWHGKSSRAIGDNLIDGGILYCVDTWAGSVVEQDTNHSSAKLKEGDHAFYEFLQNNFDLIQAGKIIPIRMTSKNAAALFKEKGIFADLIFIDASHEYKDVCEDIDAWKDVLKEDGLFSGHDFHAWVGVDQAVSDKLVSFNVGIGTTIWFCSKQEIRLTPPCVFDCFPINNELDILEIRLSELYNVVDRFIIVEATKTHGNKNKTLNFQSNLQRFEKYLHKITYVVVNDYPAYDSWSIERHQRDCIMRGLNNCKNNDIIMISDLDEIPSVGAIKSYKPEDGIKSFDMDLYYYNMKTKAADKWTEAKILTYRDLVKLTPCGARYTKAEVIPNGGKHLSYFGDVDKIIKKIEDTAHQEYNLEKFKDREKIRKAIEDGTDLFERPNIKFEKV